MSLEPDQTVSALWPIPLPAARPADPAAPPVTAWLAGIRAGDEGAFNAFYDCFSVRLYRYLFAILPGDEALVRDAFQECMLRVIRHAKPMPTEADAWRWLTRVGRSALYDLLRKRSRRQARELRAGPLRTDPDAAEARLDACLHRVLDELPDDDRALIEAFYFQRMDQQAMADRFQTTRKAVESRLARIRIRLRSRLTEVMADEH